jgi:tetratricopeptide (TPR) repeat protein
MTSKSERYTQITELFQRGDFQAGESLLHSAGDDLSDAERLECIGNEHFYRRDLQAAVDQFEALIKRFPDYYPARYHYILATQAERAGEVKEAFARYRTAIEAEETFVDAYIDLGGMLAKINDLAGAARCMERALEFDPADLRIYANLRIVYQTLASLDPVTYASRRDQLERDYPKLEAELSPLPKGSQW